MSRQSVLDGIGSAVARWADAVPFATLHSAPPAVRLGAVAFVLVVASAARSMAPEATPVQSPLGERGTASAMEGTVHYVDVEGWYRRTPDEVAVLSPFDLSLDGLPDGLPYQIGDWQGSDRPPDPAVREWFDNPDVMLERTYRRGPHETVWLSAFGSRGDKSFFLFEHTPDTCYPLSGWQVLHREQRRVELGPRPLTVNFGRAVNESGAELAFLFVYVWTDPSRDPAQGVVSLRLGSPVARGESFDAATERLVGDFVPLIFTNTLQWSSF